MTDGPMIFRKPARVLADACAFCRSSRTYCDGRAELESERCCPDCRNAVNNPH